MMISCSSTFCFICCLHLFVLLLSASTNTFVMSLSNSVAPIRHIVVVGAGIQGTSVAYQLAQSTTDQDCRITVLEAQAPASAASGKGGGFMARSWGDGTPTQSLHHLAFDMYEELAETLHCTSYRKLPVLSVSPGYDGLKEATKKKDIRQILPSWLDGKVGRISALGYGTDTAQITPAEFVQKMLEATADRVEVVLGTCVGIESDQGSQRGFRKVTAVRYVPKDGAEGEIPAVLPADAVVVSAGPWSTAAEKWFPHATGWEVPMEGIKLTSIVWKPPSSMKDGAPVEVDATALFCGEDRRFGTHCKCCTRTPSDAYDAFWVRLEGRKQEEKWVARKYNNRATKYQMPAGSIHPSFRHSFSFFESVFPPSLTLIPFSFSSSGSLSPSGWYHLYLWYWWLGLCSQRSSPGRSLPRNLRGQSLACRSRPAILSKYE